jgi:hypothetical protein
VSAVCTAVTLRVRPGQEQAYREWLAGSMVTLGPVYERTGIRAKTVMMAGRRVIAHYEADSPGAFERAAAEPESVALLAGPLAAILDPAVPPVVYPEIFAWGVTPPWPIERAGLLLSIKPGQAVPYTEWLLSRAVSQLEAIWQRSDICRHDVLVNDESVVAFYECKMRYNVLKAFREPEALAVLFTDLASLLDLDPTMPMSLFEEAFHWQRGA